MSLSKLWTLETLSKNIWSSISAVKNIYEKEDRAFDHFAAGNALNCLLSKSRDSDGEKSYSCILIFLNNLNERED